MHRICENDAKAVGDEVETPLARTFFLLLSHTSAHNNIAS